MFYTKGTIVNEFGEICGKYWYNHTTGMIDFVWLKLRFRGYTEHGFTNWLNKLDLYAMES